MTIRTFEKLFPGILPPKKSELSPDQNLSLVRNTDFMNPLDEYDPASLTDSQIHAVTVSEYSITGYSFGDTYEWADRTFPVPAMPISQRIERGEEQLEIYMRELRDKKLSYHMRRDVKYDELRHVLASAILTKAALHIVKNQRRDMTPDDIQQEEDAYALYEGYIYGKREITPEFIAEKHETEIKRKQQTELYERVSNMIYDAVDIAQAHPEIIDEINSVIIKYKATPW